jgi:hypothetical protein
MPKLDQKYRQLHQYIEYLYNPDTTVLKPKEKIKTLVKNGDQKFGIVTMANPCNTELFIAPNTFPLMSDKPAFNTPQEYLKEILIKLNSVSEYCTQHKKCNISDAHYKLLENIVYDSLALSIQFLSLQMYDAVIALLHLGEKILRRMTKIKRIKKQVQRLFASFTKQADQVIGTLYLKQAHYERALAYFQAGLNDMDFFNSEPVETQLKVRLFYQARLAQIYMKLRRICEAEAILHDMLQHTINSQQETILTVCEKLGDHYQKNNSLKAIEYYLQAIAIIQIEKEKIDQLTVQATLFEKCQPEDLQLQTLQSDYCDLRTKFEKKINDCYQQYDGTQKIAEQIQTIKLYQNLIQKMEILKGGIIKIHLTSKDRLKLFPERNFIKKFHEPPYILVFLNYTISPKNVLSTIQDAIHESLHQDLDKKRKEKASSKKQQLRENSAQETYTTSTVVAKNLQTHHFIEIPDATYHPSKRAYKATIPPSVQQPLMGEPPLQPTIIWRKLGPNNIDLQYPPVHPVYPFGGFWYGFIHPEALKPIKDDRAALQAVQSVLQRGKISNYGNAIKPTKRETACIYFFKIKTSTIRIYGQTTGHDETGKHPLIEFNNLKQKHK